MVFHCSLPVAEWFTAHSRMLSLFLPPCSPCLGPTEDLFSSRRCKGYDHQPRDQNDQMSPFDPMNAGCLEISSEDYHDGSGCKEILSQVYCKRDHRVWFGWELVAICRSQGFPALPYINSCSFSMHVLYVLWLCIVLLSIYWITLVSFWALGTTAAHCNIFDSVLWRTAR